eukprot:CAMPEP_0176403954 /NCGR_PEP_ID=MMETSP0126-20121128/50490_1 /TAXON_ID=141414 ORGANISM="Strombidinopsis acuminatum, Strain SPMC142" /NCGR_SAMPLE_ID=MMETSP0126 /ASSEMBLY_ACC=CAM_ASM_000229 /LENGTH=71 /DNA_ID=CAMNT_0017782479 /DNA_START=103 /DNA_END=318 /DNA_ORIENTATION=+
MSISYDGDYIIVGDAYTNLTIHKVCDEEENKKEKISNTEIINIKKVLSNKINANVVGAYSLNKQLIHDKES